jgi:hypothetical protein
MSTSPNNSHNSLLSEIKEIEGILDTMRPDALIERFSFEKKLQNARLALEQLEPLERVPETLRLTFRGSPVNASSGISAEFAGKASNAFADAFAAVRAGNNDNLRYMGPIPDKSKYPLMITGTAVGSFGFEMELPLEHDLFDEQVGADQAIETLKSLMRVSAEGNDDEVTELVGEIHPRAVRKVSNFLKLLYQNDAWCGLEFRDDFFKYADIDQLQVSQRRLKEENISRTEETYFGEFQGVLPQSRNFEFKIADEDTILKGKVDDEILDPDILNRDWLHRPVQVVFYVIQVGQGRPKYTLMSLDNIR